MNQKINIKQIAQEYFTKYYPSASKIEIKKQVEDWENKINAGKSLVNFFIDRVGPIQNKKILDIGFGSGGVAIAFQHAGANMFGVDINTELKNIAEHQASANDLNIDFKIYDGVKLPFSDDNFDYIICASVLEHMSLPQQSLNEMLRVLKSGGRIFLSLPNKYYPKETHTLAYGVSYLPHQLANWYLKLLRRSPLEHDNLHFYSYFNVINMLKKSDYKYKLIYKNFNQISGFKKIIILALKKLNIHYTIFLKQLIFVIEKKITLK